MAGQQLPNPFRQQLPLAATLLGIEPLARAMAAASLTIVLLLSWH
ncbi:MAG: hypothetical protein ABIK89_24310 [Planctomycetota bacterium]